jgi:ribosomal protein L18
VNVLKKYADGRELNTGRAAEEVKNTNARPTTAQPKLSYMTTRLTYEYLTHGALAAYVEKYVFDRKRTSRHSRLSATSCGCHTSIS